MSSFSKIKKTWIITFDKILPILNYISAIYVHGTVYGNSVFVFTGTITQKTNITSKCYLLEKSGFENLVRLHL